MKLVLSKTSQQRLNSLKTYATEADLKKGVLIKKRVFSW